jgi:5-formyltetrahydrofolate cyclo-ligase
MPHNGAAMPDDLAARKATVRRLALARRGRLGAGEREAAGIAIAGRLLELPEIGEVDAVLGFASFGTEVPTDPAMESILRAGKRLLVPYVDGTALRAAEVRSVDELAPGFRGIREPVARVPVDALVAGVVLVPGVAFDDRGRRLGYGGGFYDGFLRTIGKRIPRVGVCFDVQIVDEVPAGSEDEMVTVIVSERRVIRPKSV